MSRTVPFQIHEMNCKFEQWDDAESRQGRWCTLIIADRTPSDSLTVGIVELEPGRLRTLFLHKHTQVEVYYVLSGEGIITISGKEHAVCPGTAVFVPGGVEHGVSNTTSEVLRLLYVFPTNSITEVKYEFE
jgi:mannose-6-phosphate isomerase-like protein (cupin superfamily)